MFVNCYDTPTGPHYSRPYKTRVAAALAREWLWVYLDTQSKTLAPHRFVGSIRLTLKDERLRRYLNGGPTLFSASGRKGRPRKQAVAALPRVEPLPAPVGYVFAPDLARGNRSWKRYWERVDSKRHAAAVAEELGLPISALVLAQHGGNVRKQGTHIHPRLAEHFKAWLGGAERQEAA